MMPKRNITKFAAFVILAVAFGVFSASCSFFSPDGRAQSSPDEEKAPYGEPKVVGKLESDEIKESSGLTASKCQPDVFWTHNDSGDEAFLYAIDSKGRNRGTWKVAGAENDDWEDIASYKDASGKCVLFVGEIGNNARTRSERAVYRVAEPMVKPEDAAYTKKNPGTTEQSEKLVFNFPDSPHDAETLMIHPSSGDIYVVSKGVSGPAGVYKINPRFGSAEAQRAEKIADISVPAVPNGLLTGGDISPDGKRVVVCDYFAAYELVLPAGARNFDEIWKQKPLRLETGKREIGEAIAFAADGKSVVLTSEKKNSPVIEVKRF